MNVHTLSLAITLGVKRTAHLLTRFPFVLPSVYVYDPRPETREPRPGGFFSATTLSSVELSRKRNRKRHKRK